MKSSDEIRDLFIGHFESEGHLRLASAPLVPASFDPSVLLTTAGMHPLKPYFLGKEQPPANTLTSCQKCFRTTDIENVGSTARHLTFFEMLGNFSIGAYFKEGAISHAWRVATEGYGFAPEDLWITVFAGDDDLGIGADEEAIAAWHGVGVPSERIVRLGRKDNFWQAGPTGPCGPCSELYLDRGSDFGPDGERPGDDGERFLEFWNLVFMEYEQTGPGKLQSLPAKNIDTGMGLNRMAAIVQGVGSVFETDQFVPLMELGRELATSAEVGERSLRILADHARAMCFLIADGVVPSNEERGYILRRLMRRAILHGRKLGMDPGFLSNYADCVESTMSAAYPELIEQRTAIRTWAASEEEGFGRTLEAGTQLLDELVLAARESGVEGIAAADAFRLHDTHGFPIDLTLELVAEHGLGVDEAGFEALMDEQRDRARGGSAEALADGAAAVELDAERIAAAAEPSKFVGYRETTVAAKVTAAEQLADGRMIVKLDRSPFYAAGGGQVADSGQIAIDGSESAVEEVLRLGDDQALIFGDGSAVPAVGTEVEARVDHTARAATEANHTATHLLHAALRERLGDHVRQAGSYVGPDKLRFDFTHGAGLTAAEIAAVEDEVNFRILSGDSVSWRETTLEEAKTLGAVALFGEKYGDVVRLVEIGDGTFSRELCGGTHVSNTAEIGVFKILSESSSAANVRRIEALTGREAVGLLRARDQALNAIAATLRTTPEDAPEVAVKREARLKELERSFGNGAAVDAADLASSAVKIGPVAAVFAELDGVEGKALPDIADRVLGSLGDPAATVLAVRGEGKVDIVAAASPAAIEAGVRAGELVAAAAEAVGGGGGGKDSMARAGGREPEATPAALEAARSAAANAVG